MLESVSVDLYGNNFTILVMSIRTTCMDTLRLALTKKIKDSPNFFYRITPIIVDVSKINNDNEWLDLYKTISEVGLCVIGVCCCQNDTLKNLITKIGLPIFTKGKIQDNFNCKCKKNCDNNEFSIYSKKKLSENFRTKIIDSPIRSGQKIYAREKDLIIISNVSTGAEIIADGNIHIYGMMKGRVLAGASGNEEAQIFCSYVFPELVSIGGYYWLIDQIPQKFLGKSARFFLKNKTLVIQNIL